MSEKLIYMDILEIDKNILLQLGFRLQAWHAAQLPGSESVPIRITGAAPSGAIIKQCRRAATGRFNPQSP